ncbi:hypothetical protein LV716_06145 [Flagellimonas sp. HMM57]|uniref:hypothetical protein n=1 Tax=unclassified Flagellimonas TaxID=2644544 RepID=UPI0013D67EDC|nr:MULTISPECIES: hypothetical protein [unclassified Flagellimonas]UII77350.1 hypothetical protein LV716_06145 [Flagellimonas sp. HMM57]
MVNKFAFLIVIAIIVLSCASRYPVGKMTFLHKEGGSYNGIPRIQGFYHVSLKGKSNIAFILYEDNSVLFFNKENYDAKFLFNNFEKGTDLKSSMWGVSKFYEDSLKIQHFGKAGFSKLFVFEDTFLIVDERTLKHIRTRSLVDSQPDIEYDIPMTYQFHELNKKPDSSNWLSKLRK